MSPIPMAINIVAAIPELPAKKATSKSNGAVCLRSVEERRATWRYTLEKCFRLHGLGLLRSRMMEWQSYSQMVQLL